LRDEFGPLFTDTLFQDLFSRRGQPAEAPWRLALVTVLQFAEGLSDRQAADAVRRCIDWKYLLGLELTDSGFHHTILCEFRARLVQGSQEQLLFETLLDRFRERKLLKARGTQRTDSTHVLAAVRALNRLESVGETLFAREYGRRAGIEGTLSQGMPVCALRRSRYVGQAKTHLQHLLTAAALNLVRIAQWLLDQPRAKTRVSAFARLLAAPT
jgi:transposase